MRKWIAALALFGCLFVGFFSFALVVGYQMHLHSYQDTGLPEKISFGDGQSVTIVRFWGGIGEYRKYEFGAVVIEEASYDGGFAGFATDGRSGGAGTYRMRDGQAFLMHCNSSSTCVEDRRIPEFPETQARILRRGRAVIAAVKVPTA